jgi:hypothetical protein
MNQVLDVLKSTDSYLNPATYLSHPNYIIYFGFSISNMGVKTDFAKVIGMIE